MIDLEEVGVFPSVDSDVRFSVPLPGIRAADGFQVIVRINHRDDQFHDERTQEFPLAWQSGHPLDLWAATMPIRSVLGTRFGREGTYLYSFRLYWVAPSGKRHIVTHSFPDPFARATDVGRLSAFTVDREPPTPFEWSDDGYKTPDLDDLIVYELKVEEFNNTFDGLAHRLPYLGSFGVDCLELMPIMSAKLDDWGYKPLNYFAPSPRLGGSTAMKRMINRAHARGIAVILDVVYEHVDEMFPYYMVYADIAKISGAPHPPSPMICGRNRHGYGQKVDLTQAFALDFLLAANQMWLRDYHVDGFRYDEVDELWEPPTDAGYRTLVERTYWHSLSIDRFNRPGGRYSRIIQCAEALGKARDVVRSTCTNCVQHHGFLFKAEATIKGADLDDTVAHELDPQFNGFPKTTAAVDADGNPIEIPVAPFQNIEAHDYSRLIVFAGTEPDGGPLSPGDRTRFYKVQPYAIAIYTSQGIPLLFQGQEFAENYQLPDTGFARVQLRRDLHWEYFYDEPGRALVRLYRRLGLLRRTCPALRSRESFYYNDYSLRGNRIIAYHRRMSATDKAPEEFSMVLLNFSDRAETVQVPFPRSGRWQEMLDADVRTSPLDLTVNGDGEKQNVTVPSNYGAVFVKVA